MPAFASLRHLIPTFNKRRRSRESRAAGQTSGRKPRRLLVDRLEDRAMLYGGFQAHDTFLFESDGQATFEISYDGGGSEAVSVDYYVWSMQAQSGSDFTPVSGTLTFQPGQSLQTVQVPVFDDLIAEWGEELLLELHHTSGPDIIQGRGAATILVNDNAPHLDPVGGLWVDEGTTVDLTPIAWDDDLPAQTLTFSMTGAPIGATLDPATGAFSWTTTEADGPGDFSFTLRVTDNDSPSLFTEQQVTVSVAEVNSDPTAGSIAGVTVDEDALPVQVDLFAAFDDVEDLDSEMSYYVNAWDYGLFTSLDFDSSSGMLNLAFAPDAYGTTTITVQAIDTWGSYVETSFDVVINSVNDAPVISGFQGLSEGGGWYTFTGTVTDVDDDVTGWTVSFGGVLAGYSATTEYDGTFSFAVDLTGKSSDVASAQTSDPNGSASNMAMYWVYIA